MPRQARKRSSTGIYHAMLRGIDRREIFLDDEDCEKFLQVVWDCVKDTGTGGHGDGADRANRSDSRSSDSRDGSLVLRFAPDEKTVPLSSACAANERSEDTGTVSTVRRTGEPSPVSAVPPVIFAYCLMGNHVHLLLREGDKGLSSYFKRVGIRYAYWYNWKYQRTGHLFQDRFRSEAVEDDAYFLTALRYIYQNPVNAELCGTIEDYRWSSYGRITPDESWPLEIDAETEAFFRRPDDSQLLDIEQERRLTDREAAALICGLAEIRTAGNFAKLPDSRHREYLPLLQAQGLSIRQLARLTGLSKGMVEKMLH